MGEVSSLGYFRKQTLSDFGIGEAPVFALDLSYYSLKGNPIQAQTLNYL